MRKEHIYAKKQNPKVVPAKNFASQEIIQNMIFIIRGKKVMLDYDLASLYNVTTKRLNEQVKRNRSRFPEDFMFQLTENECASLRSQIATSNLRCQFGTSKEVVTNCDHRQRRIRLWRKTF